MAKAEWGVKRLCANCGAKFYDMQNDPIICPACETVFEIEVVTRGKRGRAADAVPAKAPKAPVVVDAEEDAVVVDDDDDDDADVVVADDDDDDLDTDDAVLLDDDSDDEDLGDFSAEKESDEDDENR